ncbi:MAG: hypothetical protein J6Y95_07535, partial [Lachnospiraceae bacterium]|nr:hypothetical protein [Lachnospiraceae bacterium]
SAERIREEFLKILQSAHPDYTGKLLEIGAMPFIYPSYGEIQKEAERALLLAPEDKVLRLAAFLYQGGAEDAEAFFDRLKFDNDTRNRVLHLIRYKDAELEAEPKSLRKFLSEFGKEDVDKLLLFHEKILGTDLTEVRRELKGIEERRECTSLKELALTGNDLTAMGMKPGREMGALLHELLDAVIEEPKLKTKEKLKEIAEGRLSG